MSAAENIEIRSAYDGVRHRVSIDFSEVEPLTEQSHKKMCDINHILKQYDKTGLITHVNNARAEYGDYTEVNEYQEAMNTVIKAQADFMELPSEIRKKFANDPGNFVEFVTNPDNLEEMYDLGLAIRPVDDGPLLVQIAAANDSTSSTTASTEGAK